MRKPKPVSIMYAKPVYRLDQLIASKEEVEGQERLKLYELKEAISNIYSFVDYHIVPSFCSDCTPAAHKDGSYIYPTNCEKHTRRS